MRSEGGQGCPHSVRRKAPGEVRTVRSLGAGAVFKRPLQLPVGSRLDRVQEWKRETSLGVSSRAQVGDNGGAVAGHTVLSRGPAQHESSLNPPSHHLLITSNTPIPGPGPGPGPVLVPKPKGCQADPGRAWEAGSTPCPTSWTKKNLAQSLPSTDRQAKAPLASAPPTRGSPAKADRPSSPESSSPVPEPILCQLWVLTHSGPPRRHTPYNNSTSVCISDHTVLVRPLPLAERQCCEPHRARPWLGEVL